MRLFPTSLLSLAFITCLLLDVQGDEKPARRPSVEALVAQLSSPEGSTRAAAARQLGERGAEAKSAVPILLGLFEDQDSGESGEPVWHVAAEAVGKIGSEPLPQLIMMLKDENQLKSFSAAVAIHNMGAAGKPAVPALVELLGKNNPERRISQIFAIMGIGPAAEEVVPELLKMLDSDDFHTQYWACRAFGRIGMPASKPAVPKLVSLLKNQTASVRGNAAAALGQFGTEAGPEVIPALTEVLSDRTYTVRRAAAEAVGKFGPAAKSAVPTLEKCMADENFAASSQAAVARYRITGELEPTIKVLLAELQNRNAPWDAAEGFAQIGAPANVAAERLVKLLSSPESETRVFAASSLAGIGPSAAKVALPKLKELLQDQDEDVREVASEAIKAMDE